MRLGSLAFAERKEIVRLLVTKIIVVPKRDEILIKHVIPRGKLCGLRSGRRDQKLRQRRWAHRVRRKMLAKGWRTELKPSCRR
jgi:hypothetical protein